MSADEPDGAPPALSPQGTDSKVDQQSKGLNLGQTTLANQIFAGRLIEIAAEYRQYERMEQKTHCHQRLAFFRRNLNLQKTGARSVRASQTRPTERNSIFCLHGKVVITSSKFRKLKKVR